VQQEPDHGNPRMTADQSHDLPAAAVSECLEESLRVARELLSMDVAWIAEFKDGDKVFRVVDGDAGSFGFWAGRSMPLEESYCHAVAGGALPNVIPDTAAEPRVARMAVTRRARIGSYIGVPIELGDGTVYGTLCAASHRPSELADRDADYLRGVARSVAAKLQDIGISPASG
jgi:GAF domain-containing protein